MTKMKPNLAKQKTPKKIKKGKDDDLIVDDELTESTSCRLSKRKQDLPPRDLLSRNETDENFVEDEAKKKRGRPPKKKQKLPLSASEEAKRSDEKTEIDIETDVATPPESKDEETPKRKRGRPPKLTPVAAITSQAESSKVPGSYSYGTRGREKKVKCESSSNIPASSEANDDEEQRRRKTRTTKTRKKSTTPDNTSKEVVAEQEDSSGKNRFGPKEQRTCPHCHTVMSSIFGLAYHIKHQVCRREDEQNKAYVNIKRQGKNEVPFPQIRPGASFITLFGVVMVVKDDRIPEDYGTTFVGEKEKQESKQIRDRKPRKHKGKSTGHMQSQYNLLHKSMLRQLYGNEEYSCCISSRCMPVDHNFSSKVIRTRCAQENWPVESKAHPHEANHINVNPMEPADSYPNRIVECVLLPDMRKRVYGEDEDEGEECTNLMKADVAKRTVTQAMAEAVNLTSSKPLNQYIEPKTGTEARIFMQRRLLHTLYNPDIPVYVCLFCGQHFNSSVGHKGHINTKSCLRSKLKKEENITLKTNEGEKLVSESGEHVSVASNRRPIRKASLKPKRDAPVQENGTGSSKTLLSSFIHFDPLESAVYPAVVQSLLGPILSTGAEFRLARRRRGVSMTLVHISGLDSAQECEITTDEDKKQARQDLETQDDSSFSGCSAYSSQKKTRRTAPSAKSNTISLASATIRGGIPTKPKRISNHTGPYQPKVCEDFAEIIRDLDAGKFPSMNRYYGAHADLCCVPYCKCEGQTLYCCEFCSNVSHFECLQRRVIVKNWDPEGDFICHVCFRHVLGRRARNERRQKLKEERRAAKNPERFVIPVINPMKSVNPFKFDSMKTGMYPEVYKSLEFLRKGAKTNILEKSAMRRKRNKLKKELKEEESLDMDTKPDHSSTLEEAAQSTVTNAMIIDTLVLAEEIRAGRYPSMKQFDGAHENFCLLCKKDEDYEDDEEGSCRDHLYYCDFCEKAEHMSCLRNRVTIREIDPETDDFMCHRCILTVCQRRLRAEKRRLQKREEALEKAGIDNSNPLYQINTGIPTSATALEREVEFEQSTDFDSHTNSYEGCSNGGLGGLVCCEQCTESYSRFLSCTAKEIESQTVSSVGREVSEMLELLEDAKMRLQQVLETSEANEFRRSLFSPGCY